MAIAAISLAGLSRYTAASQNITASQRTLSSLQSAINSGNLRTAQNALTRYQSLNKNLIVTTGNAQLSASLTALGQAIRSGSVTASQSAFATVQSNLQSTPSSALAAAQAGSARALSQVQGVLNTLGSSSSSSGSLNLYA